MQQSPGGAVLECEDQFWILFGSFEPKDTAERLKKTGKPPTSNWRETTAVLRALIGFKHILRERIIRSLSLRSDNMVTVFNLQRIAASESLLNETRQIYSLLTQENIRLSVSHVPGVQNDLTDALSRMDSAGDYELKQEIYDQAIKTLGAFPTIDLFACSSNRKCPRFMALPGPKSEGAIALDALAYSWQGETPYVFPPIQIMPRVLQKLREEGWNAVVVLPEWYSKAWWNLAQPNIIRSTVLGEAENVLRLGTSAPKEARLPPGRMLMAIVSFRK
jgi:hypothetical protein